MLEVVTGGLVMEVDKVADDLTEMDVVGHLVGHIVGHLVHLHVSHHVSSRRSETLTEWKLIYLITD